MLKVLIVDDSAFFRRSLVAALEKDPEIKVVGQARNGEEAVALTRELDPDVVTMDVEMPRMDGISALERIMAETPCPVLMVSSLTSEGAQTTLKALERGALDFITKGTPDLSWMQRELPAKLKALARRKAYVRLARRKPLPPRPQPGDPPQPGDHPPHEPSAQIHSAPRRVMPVVLPGSGFRYDAVAIGVSTGGPPAVQRILAAIPAEFPVPLLIAQHMPATFTGPFAVRLDSQSRISVKEAEAVERARAGTAYVCPGGKHLRLENRKGSLFIAVTEEPKEALYKPSANVLMETAGLALGPRALCVMLTGMGSDGLEGTKILKSKGGYVIAQSEATCVVYGMPKALVDWNLADEIVDLDDMAAAIVSAVVR
ncbi:MAG: chemotaxis response regulator protein-glutamate methylesterase [Deltaproteobacteria bacterium]|nr:chemotaxis response regulator protein-glutamate methylesterase [Deltaproteobacteria bacterium]